MKVLFTKPFFDSDIKYIKERLEPAVEVLIPDSFNEESLIKAAEDVDVLFGGFVTEGILKAARNLKFIQIPWTGVENVDLELIRKYHIPVCNSHSNSTIVAEHAIALMFDVTKKIAYHDRLMRSGNWNRPGINENEMDPFSGIISESAVGIIGFGAIGKDIYRMLSGFGCRFKVFDIAFTETTREDGISYFPVNEIASEIKDLDFLFLSVPLTDTTRGMVDDHFFDSLSGKCILINTSRGEIINQDSLYKALKNGKISGAGIDTWYNFPSKQNKIAFPSLTNEFHALNNIVLSPHRAGFVREGFPHLDDAIANLNRFSVEKELINVISYDKKF